ncbi:hypothetical protein G6F43_014424 [Rhizopus delemar]|nr:hypothetical protein G6F43_014424 [Rhizopus delemar]
MARTFYKYQEIVQHQKQMTLMKQQLTVRFAEDVNYWSHLKFTQPRPTPASVEAYLSSKHANLKAEIPNDFLYPSLLRAARNGDTWAIIDPRYEEFEDELMSTGGICDDIIDPFSQTVPLVKESSDLN